MKISRKDLRRIINEEIKDILSYKNASDVEAVEGVFSGGDNLISPVDHVKAQGIKETRINSQDLLRDLIMQEILLISDAR